MPWLDLVLKYGYKLIRRYDGKSSDDVAKFPLIYQVYSHLPAYEDGTNSVTKRRHINSRRRGITQKAYNNVYLAQGYNI